MEIRAAQQLVDEWIKTYGVRYFDPLTNMGILMEEVGELSRWMVREYGEQSYRHPEDQARAPQAIADEMTDILWVLLCLANQTGVDLEEAMNRNLQKKTNRDKDRHTGNPKL
jgi:NTP pyrophosphatase (non-canonical NTP hydrolase)